MLHLSHKLSDAERKYATHEQELLAIITALKVWRPYLESAEFKVNSDHKALEQLATQPKLSRRQASWVEYLQAYDCKVKYVEGPGNQADALSRRPDMAAALLLAKLREGIWVPSHQTSTGPLAMTDLPAATVIQSTPDRINAMLHAHNEAAHGNQAEDTVSAPATPSALPPSPPSSSPQEASLKEEETSTSAPAATGAMPLSTSQQQTGQHGPVESADYHRPLTRVQELNSMGATVLQEDKGFHDLVSQAMTNDQYHNTNRLLKEGENNRWYLGRLLYVPHPLRQAIIREAHDTEYSGHLGADKTCASISEKILVAKTRTPGEELYPQVQSLPKEQG